MKKVIQKEEIYNTFKKLEITHFPEYKDPHSSAKTIKRPTLLKEVKLIHTVGTGNIKGEDNA